MVLELRISNSAFSAPSLQHLLTAPGMIPREEGRLRPRIIGQDQMVLLSEAAPLLAGMTCAGGLYLPYL
jgi:hypothetical protein